MTVRPTIKPIAGGKPYYIVGTVYDMSVDQNENVIYRLGERGPDGALRWRVVTEDEWAKPILDRG